jgi:hypothetical protein
MGSSIMYQDRDSIVRLVEYPPFGVFSRYVDGLNIFLYNDVEVPTLADPRVLFLRNLTEQLPSSAHVSSLALKDMVDDPQELFGLPTGLTPYTRSRISYYNCTFYNLDEYPCYDALFFPEVTGSFWEAKTEYDTDIGGLFEWHGLAVYVGAKPGTLDEMQRLLSAPFPGEGQWLKAVTGLYSLVVTVGHDGQNFEVHTQNLEDYDLLKPSLEYAAGIVSSSEWFKHNRKVLEWDDESSCLIAEQDKS